MNCYTGCLHGCAYCYARFMKRFTAHFEPWGQFLDIKINAAEVLAREVRRRPPGRVFVSSVCDAWQPAERKYELTRQCVRLLLESGFGIHALTKSTLVRRDFDVLASGPEVTLGCTITTTDESIRRGLEPAAASSEERFRTLEAAAERGIRTSAGFAPLMPCLSDTDRSLRSLFTRAREAGVSAIWVDKLNPRPGVWNSLAQYLHGSRPDLLPTYRKLFFDRESYESYASELSARVRQAALETGLLEKTTIGF